jgi:tetraacyldisaccharide 4'-kinase
MVRTWIARGLEGGRAGGRCATYASRVWSRAARIERPLRWRDGASVVVVGGATLGGSGKTPLAVACAEELRRSGANVAFVGHAYGASPGRARIVSELDDVRSVGDEALFCARRLRPFGVVVVVADARQDALDLALGVADVVVIDGLCQTRPRRATLSLLAVDGDAPWGAGHCPPRGDLRAPIDALLRAVDRVVVIGGESEELPDVRPLPCDRAAVFARGAWRTLGAHETLLEWKELRGLRVGLWTAIARPDRVLRALAKKGIHPTVMLLGADHHPRRAPPSSDRAHGPLALDLWLTTTKCEGHLAQDPNLLGRGGVPVAVLEHAIRLEPSLSDPLRAIVANRRQFRLGRAGSGVPARGGRLP